MRIAFITIMALSPWSVECYTRLVAIGDYGSDAHGGNQAENEARAAKLVLDLDMERRLDGVLALGDNNYPGNEP